MSDVKANAMSSSKLPTALLVHLTLPSLVSAQTDLGGTGSFDTSTLAALYGLGLAAVSVSVFPVVNLSFSNELYARFAHREQNSEIFQLRWHYPGKRWQAKWNSPCILFNGLGAKRVIAVGTSASRDSEARDGAWVCVGAQLASSIAGARAPAVGKCGGHHLWCSFPGWWASLGLQSFPDDPCITAKYLQLNGCSRYNQSPPIQDWGLTYVASEHLRADKTYVYYPQLDAANISDSYRLSTHTLGTVLDHSDNAIVSTLDPIVTARLFSNYVCAGETGSHEEKELDLISHSYQSWVQSPDTFRIVGLRLPLSSAIIPLLVEAGVTAVLPWFGVTSLVIIEQIARRALWSSMSTATRKWTKAIACGGSVEGELHPECSYIFLRDAPVPSTLGVAMMLRSVVVLASYASAVYVQVAKGFVLPTRDDMLAPKAASAVGLSASATHLITTLLTLAYIRRATPCVLPVLATVLVICTAVLAEVGPIDRRRLAPAVLAAEFVSCAAQTVIALIIAERTRTSETLYYTFGAMVAELRIPLIVAVPRLAAWFVMGNSQ
ncbi:hypothetical protein NEOLEDRAFT_1176213 [Neolentinus lepideus HHB14362 ss-1]|uniref:Uncharacterized protein n=1 Tax=Neolentinus lepideus HHB14362 ss-1 TaxID=1314782 RepID=A0A165UF08_9AGAM|nr:hypothetical protein NEOLEDRAFT_1176213 [Neolentinus lepideus HHB14362 ss-1]